MEQVQEAAANITAAVWPLTSQFHKPFKMSKTYWALLDKEEQNYVTFFNGFLLMEIPMLANYIHLLCVDTGCHREDLLRTIARESQENPCYHYTLMIMMVGKTFC